MRKVINGKNKSEHLDGSSRADVIHGNGGNDGIGGHKGNDLIFGDAGNDRLHGGENHDELTGGAGSDTFIFRSFAAAHSDKVMDFNSKSDDFELDRFVFSAIDKGELSPGEFVLGAKALDGNDRVIYDQVSGELYFDDDGNGAHKQHLLATLDNNAKVSADDIFIF